MKPKLLMIAPEFAPVNTTGHYRSTAFARYLQQFDVSPIVVTVDIDDASSIFNAPVDEELSKGLSEVDVRRVPCKINQVSPKNRILTWLQFQLRLSEPFGKSWWPNLEKFLRRVISDEKPQALYLSCPPFSLAPYVSDLAADMNLPLIVDFRDLWSQWSNGPSNSVIHHAITLFRERQVLEKSRAVITVTSECAEVFKRLAGGKLDQCIVIPNGLDKSLPQVVSAEPKRTVRVGYIGSFYYDPSAETERDLPWYKRRPHHWLHYYAARESWLYRTPFFFFKALSRYNEEKSVDEPEIHFEHIGRAPEWLVEMVSQFGLSEYVTFHGFMKRSEMQQKMLAWDWALSTSEKVIDGRHYCLPSKIFEYVSGGLPILGFLTKGVQEDFIAGANLGLFVNADDERAGVSLLRRITSEIHRFHLDEQFLEPYQRINGASRLARLIKDL